MIMMIIGFILMVVGLLIVKADGRKAIYISMKKKAKVIVLLTIATGFVLLSFGIFSILFNLVRA